MLHHVVKHRLRAIAGLKRVGQAQDPVHLGVEEDFARLLRAQAHGLVGVHDVGDLKEKQRDLRQGALLRRQPGPPPLARPQLMELKERGRPSLLWATVRREMAPERNGAVGGEGGAGGHRGEGRQRGHGAEAGG